MKNLPNLFSEIGIDENKIKGKIIETFNIMFFDPKERIYFEKDDDTGYMLDTGNHDARTEGMSYGMMMAVQMDRKDIFDRLWLFSKKYMYQNDGKYKGYFAWSVKPDGTKNAEGPAPDGEEYYAMALFFASSRWGDGTEPFDYTVQARDILAHCIHQEELVPGGSAMWDGKNHYIKFVPEADFSDPSYHLPHYYELFAQRVDEKDRKFWEEAAKASREYIVKSCHPITGMAPEYAEYSAVPKQMFNKPQQFYSDAYRVAMNIGLDAAWNGVQTRLTHAVNCLQKFFSEKTDGRYFDSYMIDGTPIGKEAMHPNAIVSTLAAGSLAADGPYRLDWVKKFWDSSLRKGDRRYYDNCLYFFSLLMLSGEYRIY